MQIDSCYHTELYEKVRSLVLSKERFTISSIVDDVLMDTDPDVSSKRERRNLYSRINNVVKNMRKIGLLYETERQITKHRTVQSWYAATEKFRTETTNSCLTSI
ncbi:MAG: hypothetical protein IT273_14570 [Chitinophagales bacterium]|nr:hypothetical protein [Chitinophagales bacterium]